MSATAGHDEGTNIPMPTPAFGVSCKWKRHVRSLNPAAADVLPGAVESPSPHDWLSVEISDMQRRVV
jgi:hypothetical protein